MSFCLMCGRSAANFGVANYGHVRWDDGSRFPITTGAIYSDGTVVIECHDSQPSRTGMPYRYRISISGSGEGKFFGDRGDSRGKVTDVVRTKADDDLLLNGI